MPDVTTLTLNNGVTMPTLGLGVFQTPPPFAEGMYDRKIAGSGVAGKLEIVKP